MREERIDGVPEAQSRERPTYAWVPSRDRRSKERRRPRNGRPGAEKPEIRVFTLPTRPPDPEPEGLVERLRKRKIVQWLLAYLAMAAILLQLTEALADMWDIPVAMQRGISLGLGFGTLPALVVAWYHGELGRQKVSFPELGIVGLLVIGSGLAIWKVCCF